MKIHNLLQVLIYGWLTYEDRPQTMFNMKTCSIIEQVQRARTQNESKITNSREMGHL